MQFKNTPATTSCVKRMACVAGMHADILYMAVSILYTHIHTPTCSYLSSAMHKACKSQQIFTIKIQKILQTLRHLSVFFFNNPTNYFKVFLIQYVNALAKKQTN